MSAIQNEEIIDHKLWLTGRKTGTVTGVLDVVSFDLNQIILDTKMGILTIKEEAEWLKEATKEVF